MPGVCPEEEQGEEEDVVEAEPTKVGSSESSAGNSHHNKRPKTSKRVVDEAIVKIADRMAAAEHIHEQLDAVVKSGSNERAMFCQWMGMEATKLSEELWMSFMNESFGLIMKYRQQQMQQQLQHQVQQQAQGPQVRPVSAGLTSTPVHHQQQMWQPQPPQLWSSNQLQPSVFNLSQTSFRGLNSSYLSGLDDQSDKNEQLHTPEPVRSATRTGELVARALQGLEDYPQEAGANKQNLQQ